MLGLRVAKCLVLTTALTALPLWAADEHQQSFLRKHCFECHDEDVQKAGLDLTALRFEPTNPASLAKWIKIHDRVQEGSMPPKKQARPEASELAAFLQPLASSLASAEQQRIASEGRATRRRLNRYEYENALRDLLHAPWLQVKDALPEDGEAYRFNKIGDALDMSHVQMARYLAAADAALRQVVTAGGERPPTKTTRYYARDQRSFTGPMKFSVFNTAPERATFPALGIQGQPDVRAGKAPITVGSSNAAMRELEGVGVVASAYEPIEPKFNNFKAPYSGRYRLRLNALSVWVGPGQSNKWFIPDLDTISRGRRDEPVVLYAETPPRLLRWLGKFDVHPDAKVNELDVWLLEGETIRPDAGRLFRSRPGAGRWQNPLAEKDGQPGVVFRWLEVEGPIYEAWPTAGHKLLFGDLPLKKQEVAPQKTKRGDKSAVGTSGGLEVVSRQPMEDAERLLREFLRQAYRRPADDNELQRFLPVVSAGLKQNNSFMDSMIAAYTAVLCSPEFLCLEEQPGRLDDHALAARLSFFLWNTAPDTELRQLADRGKLHDAQVLRSQTERLLNHPRSRQFVNAFLDYWLDLRKINLTAPDSTLYSDYYLDDLLTESALEETQAFFAEAMQRDLPARNLVASDFAMLNERLAAHYGLPPVQGVHLRRVPLPKGSPRGGLMTQASVLKVTANGTTTSPVLRGVWIMERILGQPVPPPPPGVPAVEPDIRGAVTIRQQLDKHRDQAACNTCHVRIDPTGFALENFDVMGGWRERYRASGGGVPEKGIAKSGQKFAFHLAQPVDASGELPDGRKFGDVRELKRLLLEDERQIARNLARQLIVYATGAPVSFGDRSRVEQLLTQASASSYGVRSIIHELVQSELFRSK